MIYFLSQGHFKTTNFCDNDAAHAYLREKLVFYAYSIVVVVLFLYSG